MRRIRVTVLVGALGCIICLATLGVGGSAARTDSPAVRTGATPQFSPETRRVLSAILASGMGAASLPGLEVGVWVPGRGSFVEALGTSDLLTRAPLKLNDRFRIASITKSFTATAILRLVDQHRLALRVALSRYVAGIPNGNRITIAQLLNMTSGIYDYVSDPALVRAYTKNPLLPFSLKNVIAIVRRHRPLFAPGAHVFYDNSNYFLLGVIAAKVAHESLGKLIKTEILDPLRLHNTSYPNTAAIPAPFSHGYINEPNFELRDVTRSNPGFAGGAGAMISTLGDLRIWARALATGALLSPRMRALQQHTRVLNKSPKVTVSYGMGITDINGLLGHDGAIDGYGSAMFYLPSKRATIVLIGNNNDVNAPAPLIPAVAIAAYLFPSQFPNGI